MSSHFPGTLTATNGMILILGSDGHIVSADMHSTERRSFARLEDLLPLIPSWLEHLARCSSEETAANTLPDGPTFIRFDDTICNTPVQVTLTPMVAEDDSSPCAVACIEPIQQNASHHQERILEAVRLLAETFLRPGAWENRIGRVLRILGKATGVSRSYLFENTMPETDRLCMRQRFEWTAQHIDAQIDNEELQDLAYDDVLPELEELLSSGRTFSAKTRELNEAHRGILEAQGILSLAIVPVFIQDSWWGFLGFDHCEKEHDWSQTELSALKTAADIIGSAILRNNVEQELLVAMKQAEEANEVKTQFLANMSHELRTPLNGVMGAAQLMRGTDLTSEQRKFLGIITQSSRELIEIINDLLELSSFEAGKLHIEPKPFNPYTSFQTLFGMFASQSDDKQVSFHTIIDSTVPIRIKGDVKRIKQVLINLLGNAFKYTNRGEIQVTVACHGGSSPDSTTLFFEVKDTGIGIPVMRQSSIFESFSLGEDFLTKKYGGSGMGLAISKHLVEAMGGRIWFESEYGRGSSFYFTVPVKKVDDPVPLPEPEGILRKHSDKTRSLSILLAEDEQANRIVAARMLKSKGHQVTVAKNGVQALERLENEVFDLLLLDIQMPVLNGMEVIRRIRSGEVEGLDPELPVIAITAFALESEKERFLNAGMDDCLCKPYKPSELYAAIDNVMGK